MTYLRYEEIKKYINTLDDILLFEHIHDCIIISKQILFKALENINTGFRVVNFINIYQDDFKKLPSIHILTVRENIARTVTYGDKINYNKIYISFELNLNSKIWTAQLICYNNIDKIIYHLKKIDIYSYLLKKYKYILFNLKNNEIFSIIR